MGVWIGIFKPNVPNVQIECSESNQILQSNDSTTTLCGLFQNAPHKFNIVDDPHLKKIWKNCNISALDFDEILHNDILGVRSI